jgi:hypothetical protein
VDYKPAMNNPEPARVPWGAAPSLDDIAEMARAALDTLEEPFRTPARAVAIKVEDFADDETLESMKIENPYDLTGLYSGVALTLEQVSAPSPLLPHNPPSLPHTRTTWDGSVNVCVEGGGRCMRAFVRL